ncbi:TPA: HNH endonuclease [Yersinia enterocolitica]|nr:HNH endonuclease [Yersinia enterocolitica]
MNGNKPPINWNDYFTYDPDEGLLRWKVKLSNRTKIGANAGSIGSHGYQQLMIFGKRRLAHRVIWEMLNGEISYGMQIDHIDHNRLNNKIENLRLVTDLQNHRNLSMPPKNSSGAMGVSWRKSRNKWVASIRVNNKLKHLGSFENIHEAIEARKHAEKFLGFHPNHGAPRSIELVEGNADAE